MNTISHIEDIFLVIIIAIFVSLGFVTMIKNFLNKKANPMLPSNPEQPEDNKEVK
jgi:hypothetical protein